MSDSNTERLHRYIVGQDSYGVQTLRARGILPDAVIDIGANVGVFTKYIAKLFPTAQVVAVEPHPENYLKLSARIMRTSEGRVPLVLQRVLGRGEAYYVEGKDSLPSHQSYHGESVAYPAKELQQAQSYTKVAIETITLTELYKTIADCKTKMLKCDCEGAEIEIFESDDEFECLKKFDYIAMEVHKYAINKGLLQKVGALLYDRLNELSMTHAVELAPHMMCARRRHGNG